MTIKNIITVLKVYKASSVRKREVYLSDFVPKMIYRTTKTENPEATKRMVNAVLCKKIGATSYKDTAFGVIPRSKLVPLEIEGIKKAWDFIIEKSRRGDFPLTVSFLKEIHKTGFGWIFPKIGGKFPSLNPVL